eukprot:762872-Hanusia_phi.AAC.1
MSGRPRVPPGTAAPESDSLPRLPTVAQKLDPLPHAGLQLLSAARLLSALREEHVTSDEASADQEHRRLSLLETVTEIAGTRGQSNRSMISSHMIARTPEALTGIL